MTRPPFPISSQSTHLRLIRSESSNATPAQEQPVRLLRGEGYSPAHLESILGEASLEKGGAGLTAEPGVVGGYSLSRENASVIPARDAASRYCWDVEGRFSHALARNEFQLLYATLEGPAIHQSANLHWLMVQPQFQVRYHSEAHAACLGEIRLVESQRFAVLENDEQVVLLDTHAQEAPVLYLEHADDQQVIRQQTQWQLQGEVKEYPFDYRIQQVLPPTIKGERVRSLTVLEQYTSYFMERPLTGDLANAIWVPAMAPVLWGWSMRVEPGDGGWQISRRKLVMPTVSHDAWVLPVWQSNTLTCA